jgi:hypothetical protein
VVFTSKRPKKNDLFKDSDFLFKIKKCYHLKTSGAARTEITYLTKGMERLKTKNCGWKRERTEIKKLLGRGLDVKRVVCGRMRVVRGKRLLFQKSRMSVKKD